LRSVQSLTENDNLSFYGNPYLRIPTEARNRIRGFLQIRRGGFAFSRFGGFDARRIRAFAARLTMVCACIWAIKARARIIDASGDSAMTEPLTTDQERAQLLANGRDRAAGLVIDPLPVVRLFTPDARATWLLVALNPADGDTAWGVMDVGIGMPDLGEIKLSDLASIVGPRKQPVMRDRYFKAVRPLSEYLRLAQENGSIVD